MPFEHNISAIILAAGRSNRIKDSNKLLMPFRRSTIIEEVAGIITALPIREVILVTGHDSARLHELFKDSPLKLVDNPDFSQGMAGSIVKGVTSANSQTDGYMICPGDMPFLTTDLLLELCRCFTSQLKPTIVYPVFKNKQRNPVIFSTLYRADLLKRISGDKGARSIIHAHPEATFEFPVADPMILQDIDTSDDYRKFIHINPGIAEN